MKTFRDEKLQMLKSVDWKVTVTWWGSERGRTPVGWSHVENYRNLPHDLLLSQSTESISTSTATFCKINTFKLTFVTFILCSAHFKGFSMYRSETGGFQTPSKSPITLMKYCTQKHKVTVTDSTGSCFFPNVFTWCWVTPYMRQSLWIYVRKHNFAQCPDLVFTDIVLILYGKIDKA